MFILYFIIAAIITTACMSMGISADVFAPLKELSKFFIIMAMAAIGLNSNVIKLIKSWRKATSSRCFLLDWNYHCQSDYATYYAPLVIFFRYFFVSL